MWMNLFISFIGGDLFALNCWIIIKKKDINCGNKLKEFYWIEKNRKEKLYIYFYLNTDVYTCRDIK